MSEPPRLTARAQAYKKKLRGGPLKLHLEPLLENPVIEYHYDGTEKHAPNFNIDEVTADLACKIDWRTILGPNDTLEPLYNLKNMQLEEDEKIRQEKTEEQKDQEIMDKLAESMVPEAGPWATVAKALNDSLAEVDNLLDIIRIIKDGHGLVVATVAPSEAERDLTASTNSNKAFMWQANRKILTEAVRIFEPFIDSRKKKNNADIFFKELKEMRKRYVIRKVGDCLIGDLGYRTYGPKWVPSEVFDIYRVERNKRLQKGNKKDWTMIEVDVPRHVAVRTCIFVSIAFDGENQNMFKKRVINVVKRAAEGESAPKNTGNVVKDKVPDDDELENLESVGDKPNLSRLAYWENALKWSRDTLFYRDMFCQLTRECASLVGKSCSIRDDIIVVSLFENVMLKIEKCESPFVEGDLTDLGDSYLKSLLKAFYYDDVNKPSHRPAHIVTMPNLTGPIDSEFDGPFCLHEEELRVKYPPSKSLIERMIAVTSHYFLIKTAIEVITAHQSEFTDPVITWKWQRNSSMNSVMLVTVSTPGFEYVPKHTFHIRVTESNIELIVRDGNVVDCRRDKSLLVENLHYQSALFWFTSTTFIAVRTSYIVLQGHTNQFDEEFRIAPTLLLMNPNGTRQILFQFFSKKTPPVIMVRQILDADPEEIGSDITDQRKFTLLRNSRIPGSTFLKKIETIFAFLRF